MSKRKVKKGKILLLLFIIVALVCLGLFFMKKKKNVKPAAIQVEVIDTIDNFDYQLNDNETEYYNSLFNSLKDLLSQDDYDEKEYASIIGKLFLTDFYDLDNKVMKSDVGGTQFVYADYRNDFEKGAIDTVYKSVESNVYGDRKQVLPVVKSVEVSDIYSDSFEYNYDIDYDAYYITFDITYEKDLEYPNSVTLVLIHNDDKLEIAKMETN